MTDEEKIAAYIRDHGVTLCPPAYGSGPARVETAGNIIAVDFGSRHVRAEDRASGRP